MPDVQRYLREGEREIYERVKAEFDVSGWQRFKREMTALENLSACRALLEKHQYRWSGNEFDNSMYCVGCFAGIFVPPGTSNTKLYTDKIICKPDCAIAAQLVGVRGGK